MIKRIWSEIVIRLALLLNKKQPKFGVWCEVEGLKSAVLDSLKKGEIDLPSKMYLLLSKSFNIKEKVFENVGWEKAIILFYYSIMKNAVPLDLPCVTIKSIERNKRDSWDYDGRLWHYYSHILSSAYGWTLDEIAKLKVYDAMAHIQEIWVDEQLNREFWWTNQGNATIYDAKTKTSRDNPLPRPPFMMAKVKEIKKFRIPASMIPAGADMSAIDEKLRPQEIKPD
jgi:hypothetical protein